MVPLQKNGVAAGPRGPAATPMIGAPEELGQGVTRPRLRP